MNLRPCPPLEDGGGRSDAATQRGRQGGRRREGEDAAGSGDPLKNLTDEGFCFLSEFYPKCSPEGEAIMSNSRTDAIQQLANRPISVSMPSPRGSMKPSISEVKRNSSDYGSGVRSGVVDTSTVANDVWIKATRGDIIQQELSEDIWVRATRGPRKEFHGETSERTSPISSPRATSHQRQEASMGIQQDQYRSYNDATKKNSPKPSPRSRSFSTSEDLRGSKQPILHGNDAINFASSTLSRASFGTYSERRVQTSDMMIDQLFPQVS